MYNTSIMSSNHYIPRNEHEKTLFDAFHKLKTSEDVGDFLRDLLTPAEIEEFANRFEIARLLTEGQSYLAIANKLHVSTTTVTRVAHWLNDGCGGYKKALRI